MGEVEPENHEPHEVDRENPPAAEGGHEQVVGVVLIIAYAEHLGELHVGPEVGEVHGDAQDDEQTEHEHVAGGP